MLPQDKQLIIKLRKRISLLIILIFSLCYWIRINYYELDWKSSEIDIIRLENSEKDQQISSLQRKLDSIKNIKQEVSTKKDENIINKKKKETIVKTDTSKLIETTITLTDPILQPVDSIKN